MENDNSVIEVIVGGGYINRIISSFVRNFIFSH